MMFNILDEYVSYIEKNLKNISKLTMGKYFVSKHFNELFDVYKKVRYYDAFEMKKSSFKENVIYYLNKKISDIKNLDDLNEKNVFAFEILPEIFLIDFDKNLSVDKYVLNLSKKRKDYFGLSEDNFEKSLSNIIKELVDKKNKFMGNFFSKNFEVNYYLTNLKKVYNVKIKHNIKFPKLYSEYAIDKVFNFDVVGEDKLFIEYQMVNVRLLSEIIQGDFSKNYLLEFQTTIFEKKEKLVRLLKLIDNDITKENFSMKIDYSYYKNNKDIILDMINNGYNFCLFLDNSYDSDGENNNLINTVFKYIMIDANSKYISLFDKEKVIKVK
ncbi:MAG: hypothetical protein ACI4PE_00065 [Bacilli bacterium]